MSNIRYRLKDNNNKTLSCTLTEEDIDIIRNKLTATHHYKNREIRAGKISNAKGTVYLFSSNKDHINSKRKFQQVFNGYIIALDVISKNNERIIKDSEKVTLRLLHNLISLNAHNIQEFHTIVPQEKVSAKMGGQISYIASEITKKPNETAQAFLKIAKNNIAMKTEFSVFNKLHSSQVPTLRPTSHIVHKVLMNVFYLFFSEFSDKGVIVNIAPSTEHAYFDYETIHVALYHIIDNAAKYIKPSTNLDVRITRDDDIINIEMDMISSIIDSDEQQKIFTEGYSGTVARSTAKAGSGLCMSTTQEALKLNKSHILLNCKEGTIEIDRGLKYQNNIFTIKLPRKRDK
tara:strand:- start:222 stop:1259 length:1038 start_codon:yes stop_codon:yes gene_type:complete